MHALHSHITLSGYWVRRDWTRVASAAREWGFRNFRQLGFVCVPSGQRVCMRQPDD